MKKSFTLLNIALACLVSVPASTFAMEKQTEAKTPWYSFPKTTQFCKDHKKKLIGGLVGVTTAIAGGAYALYSNCAQTTANVVSSIPVAPVVKAITKAPVAPVVKSSIFTLKNGAIGAASLMTALSIYYIVKNAIYRFCPCIPNKYGQMKKAILKKTPLKQIQELCEKAEKYRIVSIPKKVVDKTCDFVTYGPKKVGCGIVYVDKHAKTGLSICGKGLDLCKTGLGMIKDRFKRSDKETETSTV